MSDVQSSMTAIERIEKSSGGRIKWIDFAKGIGTILVVLGHVTHGYLAANTFPFANEIITLIDKSVYSFHMMFFFMISGITFYLAYNYNFESKKDKIKRQILNIIWIFSLFSIVQWIFKHIFSSWVNETYSLEDLLLFFIQPMSPYWYLWDLAVFYGLFWIFNSMRIKDVYILFIAGISYILVQFIDCNVVSSPYCVPVFFIAFAVGNFIAKNYEKYINISNLAIRLIFVCGVICLLVMNFDNNFFSFGHPFGLYFSYILIVVLHCIDQKYSKLLCKLGKMSIEIYTMHCFITAPLRKALLLIGIKQVAFNLVMNVVLAIIIPIGVTSILKKFGAYRFIYRFASLIGESNH